MSKLRRIGLVVFIIVLGLVMGFAASAAQYRMGAVSAPMTVHVGGSFGAPVGVTVEGRADFEADDGLVPEFSRVDEDGQGRVVDAGTQVLARATSFYLREDGLTAETGSQYLTGVAGEDSLGDYAAHVVGKHEGSRIVLVQPETRRAGTVTVIDLLYTVLPGQHGATEPSNGLPGVAIGADGFPTITAGGGAVGGYQENQLITGGGQQVKAGDTVVVNYLLVSGEGKVLENTWTSKAPVVMTVDDVFDGLQSGLKDTRVGSRLVLAVPAAQAQGEADVAIVMDVLAKLPKEG